jgi:hypothetical protein
MLTLLEMLIDYELDLLSIIAHRWDVDLDTRHPQDAAKQLNAVMLDPQKAAHEWSRLTDRERAALQMLLASADHKMPLAKYARLFGDIRQMGSERRQREKPHLSPQGIAEILYYRGIVGLFFDQGAAGAQQFIFVPHDLAAVLPAHETGYDLNQDDGDDDLPSEEDDYGETELTHRADTALVDDITTLLAYLQLENVQREGGRLSQADRQASEDYWIGDKGAFRAQLMMTLLIELELAVDNPAGFFKPIPNNARRWLDQNRTQQMRSLIQAWQGSKRLNELHFLPGLTLEGGSWQNDPTLIRQTIKKFLKLMPENDWFSVIHFISTVKKQEPDFQRPGADYQSWYIRDAKTNKYLTGFEHWDRIDGAVLHLTLVTVMYWLGMVDLGESEIGDMVRLTAYGRAFAEMTDFPDRPDPAALLIVEDSGVIQAPRSLSRYDRFQLARFTDWGLPGDPYDYALTPDSLARADAQGIKAEHIRTFLNRTSQNKVPKSVLGMLEQWEKTGGAQVVLSHLDVLETDTEQALDGILETPQLRRYLGRRLGARAVAVREGQWAALLQELQERGILVEEEK